MTRRQVGMTGSWILGLYVVVLGFLLVQNIYGVWPPFESPDVVDCDEFVAEEFLEAGGRSADRPEGASESAETTPPPESGAEGAGGAEGSGPAGGTESTPQTASGNEVVSDQSEQPTAADSDQTQDSRLCTAEIRLFIQVTTLDYITSSRRILLIVLLMGALGSWIHVASSYVQFVGNRTLVTSWLPWYVVRPIIGSALAVVFYIVMRAGFVTDVPDSGSIFYSMAAAAGMVGLFTAIATEKLRDVFTALFAPRSADRDTLEGNPQPRTDGIEPPDVFMDEDQTVILNGAGFVSDSKVLVNGQEHEFTLKGENKIELTLSVEELSKGPEMAIVVRNPEPGGGDSEPAKLVVKP